MKRLGIYIISSLFIFQSCLFAYSSNPEKLISELETGGNIKLFFKVRLEEGKGCEKWYVSCVDLIKSRFYKDEMKSYGIKDI